MMKEVIRTRGNLSAPGRDRLTNPILKLECESACNLMLASMCTVIDEIFCPEEWKGTRTILVYKGGPKDDMVIGTG
jgi:hypothetical protein